MPIATPVRIGDVSVEIVAILLLIDDRAGALLAQRRGLAVTGTLGVMDLASRAGLLDLRDAFVLLRKKQLSLSSFAVGNAARRSGEAQEARNLSDFLGLREIG